MTATYSYPGADPINLVRWYLGDTATGDDGIVDNPLVTDAEIVFALSQKNDDAKAAAAFAARYASIKLIHEPKSVRLLDFSGSSGGGSAKELAAWYLDLAERLERETTRPGIYAGGISVSDKDAVESDTDRAPPAFYRGMHDYEGGD